MDSALLWFPMWAKEYMGDPKVAAMSVASEGILLRLWCFSWDAGSLPNKSDVLRRICKNEVSIEAINEVLGAFFELNDDATSWTSERLEHERRGATDRRTKQQARTAAATAAAAERRHAERRNTVTSSVTDSVTDSVTSSSSPSPSPSPKATAAAAGAIVNLNVRLSEHPLCNRVFQAMADLPWLLDDLALCACNAMDGMGTTRGRAASVEDLVAGFSELAGSEVAKKRHPYKPATIMTWISNATGRRESPAKGYAAPLNSADQLKARRLAREKAS